MGQIFRAEVMRPFTRRLFHTVRLVLRQLMPNELECPMCERMQNLSDCRGNCKRSCGDNTGRKFRFIQREDSRASKKVDLSRNRQRDWQSQIDSQSGDL